MPLSWEDFDEAIGEGGLLHIVRKGEKVSLCGYPVTDRPVERQRVCPLCRHLRREAMRLSGESPDQE
jgi:hypothetical protein